MILSDSSIRAHLATGAIRIQPVGDCPAFVLDDQIGPASVDFRLGNQFKYYTKNKTTLIDPYDDQGRHMEHITLGWDQYFVLHPGQFVLGVTMECITLPDTLVARCEGRSSLGRLGLIIHSTAGFIDPGRSGTITLEMTNINEVPLKLYPGMKIGQYAFQTLDGTVQNPYNTRASSKYYGQIDVQESKLYKDN